MAKGGVPREKGIRDLAWVVVRWAEQVRPRIIALENVEEFVTWGPLDDDGMPCPRRKGQTFARFKAELERLGYVVEHRELRASDYGAPTIRKRLFLIARCDGRPIVWPAPTHGAPGSAGVLAGRLQPWRTAAEIIDWSLPCPSIFLTREEGRAVGVNRPLAEATLRRIAKGVERYVLKAARPFIVGCGGRMGQSDARPVDRPVQTITAKADSCLAIPIISYGQQGGASRSIAEPMHTICASVKDINQLVAPVIVGLAHGDSGGRRTYPATDPLTTVQAGGGNQALVAAFLAQHNTGVIGRPATEPVSTICQTGTQQAIVEASFLSHQYGSGGGEGDPLQPMRTVTAEGFHAAEVRAFLVKYYGADQDPRLEEPLHTVTTRDRFGLVTVEGQPFEIVDIGMRMLTPRELFRAQGFPEIYSIDRGHDGRHLPKTAQVRMCGNSVCPPLAAAIVAANYVPDQPPLARRGKAVKPGAWNAGPLFVDAGVML